MVTAFHRFFLALPVKLREEDKHQHIMWSFWLTLAARVLWPAPWALAAVLLVGLAKELWDSRFGSGFCWFDMVGNLIGIMAGLFVAEQLPLTLCET